VRRLILPALLGVLVSGCRREKIRLEPTEEGAVSISSVVKMSDPAGALQLVKGFHQIEQNAWRWTAGHFSITLRPPDNAQKGAVLVADFVYPEAAFGKTGPTGLSAIFNGQQIGRVEIQSPGSYTLRAPVPAEALRAEAITFDFELSKYVPTGTLDGRELGVIARSIGLESP